MKWVEIEAPIEFDFESDSWFFKMKKAYKSDKYIVMNNDKHIAISRIDNKKISWAEKQQIKNELFGCESMAIEIFTPESKLVANANVYHLWLVNSNEFSDYMLK